jgi:hypothetical protein
MTHYVHNLVLKHLHIVALPVLHQLHIDLVQLYAANTLFIICMKLLRPSPQLDMSAVILVVILY